MRLGAEAEVPVGRLDDGDRLVEPAQICDQDLIRGQALSRAATSSNRYPVATQHAMVLVEAVPVHVRIS
jgi:hypothetical protein